MFTVRKGLISLWLLLIAGFLIGCSPKSTPPGANSISNMVDGARYSYHYWDEGLAILIWHDVTTGGEGCSGEGSTEDPVFRLECDVDPLEGPGFNWQVQTSDGLTAEMWIDGQRVDLSQGAMFLIKTQDGDLQVEQLQRDFSALEPNYDAISALATSDPDVAGFIASIDRDGQSPDVSDEFGLAEFTEALQMAGQSVEVAGTVDQPFFSVPGQIVVVNGEDVQVFEYPDSTAAAAEAAQISPDGSSVGTSMISWVAPPHFYSKDRLIVLYVGENESIAGSLIDQLGEPIAEGQGAIFPPPGDTAGEPALSFEPATYRNEANGFEFDYPAAWTFTEQVFGPRGSGAQFFSEDEDEVIFSATVFLWDPKNDLDDYVELRKQGWSSSSTVVAEEEVSLADGKRAFQFEIQGPNGSGFYSLLTEVGENYLELSSPVELAEFAEIAQTLRFLESPATEP